MADTERRRNDEAASAHQNEHPLPAYPENPATWSPIRLCSGSNIRKFSEYSLYVMLGILAAIALAALGILTLPVSVALLLAFIITYTVINIASATARRTKREKYKKLENMFALSTTLVSLLLILSFIILFVVFRVHSSLKHQMVYGLEVWKWLEIALVTCLFCNLWMGGAYVLTKVQEEYDYKKNRVYFTDSIRRAVNCICFVIGEHLILAVAPNSRKSVIIYGLALWKWITSVALLLCGWYIIRVITRFVLLLLEMWQNRIWNNQNYCKEEEEKRSNQTVKKYAVFMAKGLRTRLNFLLFLLLIFLTWMFYVKPRLKYRKLHKDSVDALDFAIRTFITLSITAVLSLVKKFLLLLWEARELYKKFNERIFRAYMQLYFLAKFGGYELKFFSLRGQEGGTGYLHAENQVDLNSSEDAILVVSEEPTQISNVSTRDASQGTEQETAHKEKKQKKQDRIEKDACDQLNQILKAATRKFVAYDMLKRMAKLFLDAEKILASDKVDKLLQKWQQHFNIQEYGIMHQNAMVHAIDLVYQCALEEGDAECLYAQLKALDSQVENLDNPSEEVHYKTFENWMKVAHKNCSELGHTLAGAREAVSYLNKIMFGFLVVVCIIIWLFVTRLATTELMVLLTSPIVSAAFIFGETAKTLFQGIIFAFAVHPFDVGDICVIEGKQLEVKKVGIWKTAFYKNGNKFEEVLYPNSTLINTSIEKHNLDLNDSVEFNVQFDLASMMTKIRGCLERNNDFDSEFHDVIVKEIGETVKMEVQFKHKNFRYMTYSECIKKKNDSRSKLLQDILALIAEVRNPCSDQPK